MPLKKRLAFALRAGGIHLLASLVLALLTAALVFELWFPAPFDQLAGGRELFSLVVMVDVIMGPLLTIVVFDIVKPRSELIRDLLIIIALQLAALSYGLFSAFEARPVFLAFEGDRFRLVSAANIDTQELPNAPESLRTFSLSGPQPLGVRLAEPDDPEYLESIQLAVQGVHPSFRPARWVPYELQAQQAIQQARPLSTLEKKSLTAQEITQAALSDINMQASELAYLPLIAGEQTDWIVVINKINGQPVATLHLDGWETPKK